jgi:hypothetical protein
MENGSSIRARMLFKEKYFAGAQNGIEATYFSATSWVLVKKHGNLCVFFFTVSKPLL